MKNKCTLTTQDHLYIIHTLVYKLFLVISKTRVLYGIHDILF